MKQRMKNRTELSSVQNMKKRIKKIQMAVIATGLYAALPTLVYASEPKIVTGTRSLLASVIGILTGLVVAFITFNGLKVGTQWVNASAEERPKYQKELINVIIAGVVTLTIGGTITWIVGFYQG